MRPRCGAYSATIRWLGPQGVREMGFYLILCKDVYALKACYSRDERRI